MVNKEHMNEGSKTRPGDRVTKQGARISCSRTKKCTKAFQPLEECDTISFYCFNLRVSHKKRKKKLVAALDNIASNQSTKDVTGWTGTRVAVYNRKQKEETRSITASLVIQSTDLQPLILWELSDDGQKMDHF